MNKKTRTPNQNTPDQTSKVCLGCFANVHGVRGLLTVRSFTQDPKDIAAFGPVTLASGKQLKLSVKSQKKAGLIVAAEGIDTREKAEALKGQEFFVDKSKLPPPKDDEWYLADLVGLGAMNPEGAKIGEIIAVEDFGAGDLLEIKPDDQPSFYLAFTKENVPEVDIAAKKLVVNLPTEVIADTGGDDLQGSGP